MTEWSVVIQWSAKITVWLVIIFFAAIPRYCGVHDPSWSEINHFVNFLSIQLSLCEKSVFCNEDFVGDVLKGFKTFVVKFMIQMSRVSKIITHVCEVMFDKEAWIYSNFFFSTEKLWIEKRSMYSALAVQWLCNTIW